MNNQETSQKRLVLCFDGTGNKFIGDDSDTNIVKIYQMLDRTKEEQYHYYQPGIGTYAQNSNSNSSTPIGLISRFKAWLDFSLDQAVGTTFVDHVLAGYQFIMRYYSPGDLIYVFGFSRGAYTARFLAEMINDIGLLSKGNEEMVHFAWTTFSDYQRIRNDDKNPNTTKQREHMNKFKKTFCRRGVEIYFLGLFDCVNSVGQFEIPFSRKSFKSVPTNPATHIRHAVSIDERRLKFKPALFQLDDTKSQLDDTEHVDRIVSIKECWFSGNHGDVGGGWERGEKQNGLLLSDMPLEWMIHEIKELPDKRDKLAFNKDALPPCLQDVAAQGHTQTKSAHSHQDLPEASPHDMLAFGGGASNIGTLGWWILEVLPFFTRLELEGEKVKEWVPRYWPPNLGAKRDIPAEAEIHSSVQELFNAGVIKEMPVKGGDGPPVYTLINVMKMCAAPSLLALGILGGLKSYLSY